MSVSLENSYDIWYDGTDNVSRFDLFIDSSADLSGLTHYDNVKLAQGSKATDISTGDIYRMTSAGSWILQPQSIFQNVYTKAEIDSIIDEIDTLDTKQTQALVHIIDTGSKNRLNQTAVSRVHNGVTFTVNQDGTVTATGTATANAYIQIAAIPPDGGLFDGTFRLSGCPEGGSQTTYALYAAAGNYARYDYGNSISLIPTTLTSNIYVIAMVYSGATVDNLVFKPMICSAAYWDITRAYVPYCPTLPELYKIVNP